MRQKRVKVIYAYSPQNSDELELKVGDIIDVLGVVEEGWWKGKLKGKLGVFPSNFVQDPQSEDNTTDDSLPGQWSSSEELDGSEIIKLNRHVKSGSTEELGGPDVIKPKHVVGVPTPITLPENLKKVLKPVDGGSGGSEIGKSVPKKPPPPAPQESDTAPRLPPKPTKEVAKVLFPYDAQNDDELTIKEGDLIHVISKECEDVGWWKGEINGKVGVFPDNFVQLIKQEDGKGFSQKKMAEAPATAKNASPLMSSSSKVEESSTSSSPSKVSHAADAPLLPGKKPKLPNSKPDVVPQETLIKDKGVGEVTLSTLPSAQSSDPADPQFVQLDSTMENKLTHLTASRAKGPKDRRPPSLVGFPKDIEKDINGDSHPWNKSHNHTNNIQQNETNDSKGPTNNDVSPKSNSNSGARPQTPQWMLELRMKKSNQDSGEKSKKKSLDGDGNQDGKPPPVPASPTKSSPNRFSGDYSSRVPGAVMKSAEDSSDTSSASGTNSTPQVSILKPVKAAKPGSSPVLTKNRPDSSKEIAELQKEVRIMKETMVAKKEFNDLFKKFNELRESVESQKNSYGTLIKDLINDVAEERKKLATLQIEVDRLRKLTTTV